MTIKVKASPPLRTHADPSNAEHALAGIKAWNQLLVARGNRLVEIAMREREAMASRNTAARPLNPRKASDHRIA
jgi:hypothetical protein